MRYWLKRLLSTEQGQREGQIRTLDAGQTVTLRQAIRDAHREWKMAQSLFDQVEDPELVDYAAHRLLAAQKRYMYLLKKKQHDDAKVATASETSRPEEG